MHQCYHGYHIITVTRANVATHTAYPHWFGICIAVQVTL